MLPLPAVGAGRGLESRVGWGGMAIGTIAVLPPRLPGPFGSDVGGGPCCNILFYYLPFFFLSIFSILFKVVQSVPKIQRILKM